MGVKAVVAVSFERIHRSNLIGMGVLPFEFLDNSNYESWKITGEELFSIETKIAPQQTATLLADDKKIPLRLRLDTPLEVEYYRQGGIMPYVLRQVK